jgi:hypothetical protein
MIRKWFLLLIISFSATAWANKNLYLTVYRDFGVNETPEIQMHFNGLAPIELRILKPKDIHSFLNSQIDIRRSWRAPRIEHNTSNDLVQGLNHFSLGLGWLRHSMNEDLRNKFKTELGGGKMKRLGTALPLGPDKLITSPEDLKLVERFFFYPDEHDGNASYDVPGFDYWDSRSELKMRSVTLPKLPGGFWVVQAVQGKTEGQVVLVVNDLYGSLQVSEGEAIIRVTDRRGREIEDVAVTGYTISGKKVLKVTSDDEGVATAKTGNVNELVWVLEHEKFGVGIIDSEFYSSRYKDPDVYIYTERPMYKTEHEIFFKGIMRQRQNGILRLFKGGNKVSAAISGEGEKKFQEQDLNVSSYGSFIGRFDLSKIQPDELPPVMQVQATVDGVIHAGEMRKFDYQKPLIFGEVKLDQTNLQAGDTLTGNVHIKRYAGGVVPNANVKVTLYRSRASTPRWIEDARLGEDSLASYGFDRTSAVDVNMPVLIKSDEFKTDNNGKGVIEIALPKELPGDGNYDWKFDLKLDIQDEDENFATAAATIANQTTDHVVVARSSHVYASAKDRPILTIVNAAHDGSPYGNVRADIRWVFSSPGKADQELKQFIQLPSDGKQNVKYPDFRGGEVVAHVTIADAKNRKRSAMVSTLVVGDDGQVIKDVKDLQLVSRKEVYRPNEDIKVLVLLPENWGEDAKGRGLLHHTVVGDKIFDHAQQKISGRMGWITLKALPKYGQRFFVVVSYSTPNGWVERRVSFKVPPVEKWLKVAAKPVHAMVMPGGQQELAVSVTDHTGKGVMSELSISVVDKAVLDLQPEIRPPLLAFFYPDPRLNLMTFLSTHFQGYGYGEKVARMYRPNHFFAKSKGPETKEKDTAYWAGQVVTDKNGKAKVSFKVPQNQTIWNVIVVAADADDRFGEARSDFKAQLPISLELSYPEFIRTNDISQVTMRVQNQLPPGSKPDAIEASGKAEKGVELSAPLLLKTNFEKASSSSITGMIKGLEVNTRSSIGLTAKFSSGQIYQTNKTLRVLSDEKVMPTDIPIINNKMEFQVSSNNIRSHVLVNGLEGLLGTLSPTLTWLKQYPHGCLEQLMSSTFPNFAYTAILEHGGAAMKVDNTSSPTDKSVWDKVGSLFSSKTVVGPKSGKIDPVTLARIQALQEEALANGQSGLSQLGSMLSTNGQMEWFDGSGPSLDVQLYVLMGAAQASMLTKKVQLEIFGPSVSYLRRASTAPTTVESVVANYILAVFGKRGSQYVQSADVSSRLHMHLQGHEKRSLLELALIAETARIHGDVAKVSKDQVKPVVSLLLEKWEKSLEGKIAREGMVGTSDNFNFPGGPVAILALATQALANQQALDPARREKARKWLLSQFNGRHFGSTLTSSMVILNSIWAFEWEAQLSRHADIPSEIILNGKKNKLTNKDIVKLPGGFQLKIPTRLLQEGKNVIELPKLPIVYSASADFTQRMSAISSFENGYKIERKIFHMDETTKALKELKKLELKTGQLYYIRVNFNSLPLADKNILRSRYQFIELDIPAGLSLISEDREVLEKFKLAGHPQEVHRQITPERVRWYLTNWRVKENEYGVIVRALYPGEYASGVARVEDFYNEKVSGHSESTGLTIK